MTTAPLRSGLRQEELTHLSECVSSGEIFSGWLFVRRVEAAFASYFDRGYAMAVGENRSPLSISLRALQVEEGDEIILPATASQADISAVESQAATPVLVDVNKYSWNIDTTGFEDALSARTRAVLLKNRFMYGGVSTRLQKLSMLHDFDVVEDVTVDGGAGSEGRSRERVGSAVSYYRVSDSMSLLSGSGAVCMTDNDQLRTAMHAAMKASRGQANLSGSPLLEEPGMTNLQAAVIYVQLERWRQFVAQRKEVTHFYMSKLESLGFKFPTPAYRGVTPDTTSALVPEDINRDKLVQYLQMRDIGGKAISIEMVKRKDLYRGGSLPVGKKLDAQGVVLPFNPIVDDWTPAKAVDAIRQFVSAERLSHAGSYRRREIYP